HRVGRGGRARGRRRDGERLRTWRWFGKGRGSMSEIRCEECHWRMPDGESLFGLHWSPAEPHGGGIYLLHGLGEHSGRYAALAAWLAERGWQVRAHDHHGHGRSPGLRGSIPRAGALVEDAAD